MSDTALEPIGNVEVRSNAHIVVDGIAFPEGHLREINLDTPDNRQLVKYGLVTIVDDELRASLPQYSIEQQAQSGCGCG